MERLTKALKKAEKEKGELLAKVEKSDVAMIQLLEERVASTKGEQKLRQQNDKLQALCRTLQARLKDSGTGDKAGTQTGTVDAEEAPPAPQTPA